MTNSPFRTKLGRFLALICLSGMLVAGCAGENTGLSSYKRGDYTSALREFQAEDNSSADFAVGVMYYKGEGVKRDLRQSTVFFKRAAEQGHAGAQYNLGLMYASGQGVTRDYREAARWYRLAAERGYANAQYNLGIMYIRGDGVEKDPRKALRWLARSARQGNTCALKRLKSLLEESGNDVTINKNYPENKKM